MSEAENLEEQEEYEPTVDEIQEEIVNAVTKKDITNMVSAIQAEDDKIATAKENKRAVYAALANKGCDKAALQDFVRRQTKPPASNNRQTATTRALIEITGQTDLFVVK